MPGFSFFSGRKRNNAGQTPTVQEFYESRARRISVFRWILILLATLFIVYGFLIHGSELTMDNFRYMLKFLSFTETDHSMTGELVRFDYAEDNRGSIYKGDIVVLNGSGISVYSQDAEKVFSFAFRMDNPRLVTTEDSIFAYDLGGKEVRIFNSYSQIARITLDYPIYGFSAVSNAGFAIITSEKNYRTAIYVYDQYARQTYRRLLSETYADYVALREDGKAFALLGHYSQGGYLVSFLQTYSVSREDPVVSVSFTGEMPLKVAWLDGGKLMAMTGSALRVYDPDASEPSVSLSLDGMALEGCTVSHGKILLSASVSGLSGGSVLQVLNERLEELLKMQFEGAIDQKTLIGDTVYVMTVGEIREISMTEPKEKVYPVSQDAVCILENASGQPVVFEKKLAALLSSYSAEPSSG